MLDISIVNKIKNIPLYSGEMVSLIGDFKSPKNKLSRLEHNGDIIRLKKGLYILNSNLFGYPISQPLCANHIYGPSYLSLQWALGYYGLIPEQVKALTSVTFKRSRIFKNAVGYFSYTQMPESWFPVGIQSAESDGITFAIASPEKALCDLLVADIHISDTLIGLQRYLEEDIRFDTEALHDFDVSIVKELLAVGRKKKILSNLVKIIEKS